MDLRKTAFKGASWSLVAALATALIQILRPAILTSFLAKSDFGLMAILMLVLGIVQIFTDLGVSVALFSTKNITKREYSSLYWFSILTGVILYSILYFASPGISLFYKIPELSELIPIIGLDLLITIAGRQFQIFRQKKLQFKILAILDIMTALISFITAVFLANYGFGVLSLVYSALAASIFKTGFLIFSGLPSHPLVLAFDFNTTRRYYNIGLYQTGSQLLDYLASQIDIIIIGKLMNASDLGVYNLIKQLVIRPYGLINSVITRVSIPIMASFNDQIERLRVKYLEMIKTVAFINILVYALIALFAYEIVIILYGDAYLIGVPYLQILCLWGAAASITNSASTAIVFMGRTQLGFRWTIFRFLTNPILLLVGAWWGLMGIVLANAVCGIIYLIAYHPFLVKRIFRGISFRSYSLNYSFLFINGFSLFLLFYIIKQILYESTNFWLTSVVLFIGFGSMYLLVNKKTFGFVLELISGSKNNK